VTAAAATVDATSDGAITRMLIRVPYAATGFGVEWPGVEWLGC